VKAGWKIQKLGALIEIQNGYAFSSKDYSESGYFLMRIGNVQNGFISTEDPKFIKLPADGSMQRFVLSENDILVSLTGNVGRIGVIEKRHLPAALNQRVARITCRKDSPATRDLLLHFLCSDWFKEELIKAGHGAAQQNVSTKDLIEIEIPVPAIEEQHRIVTLLDEAFADIATANANAEKNLQNARSLFASRMQTLFDEDQSWERVQLEELLSRGWIESHLDGNHGSDYPRKEEFVESGVPYIAARALRGWEVDFSEAKYLTHERAATIRKGLAQDRDVLFAHNATVGPVGILKTNEPFVILGTSLTYYRCNENLILPEYLAHFMRSPAFVDQYSQVMKQSTRNQVPITKQREFFHVIPPLSIQQKIANDLDSLSEKIELLESIYRQKLTALEDLKKSLLHQAFSGQL
jgi:type I restriction enzyme, S subunit